MADPRSDTSHDAIEVPIRKVNSAIVNEVNKKSPLN